MAQAQTINSDPLTDAVTAAYRQGLALGEALGRRRAVEEANAKKKAEEDKATPSPDANPK